MHFLRWTLRGRTLYIIQNYGHKTKLWKQDPCTSWLTITWVIYKLHCITFRNFKYEHRIRTAWCVWLVTLSCHMFISFLNFFPPCCLPAVIFSCSSLKICRFSFKIISRRGRWLRLALVCFYHKRVSNLAVRESICEWMCRAFKTNLKHNKTRILSQKNKSKESVEL